MAEIFTSSTEVAMLQYNNTNSSVLKMSLKDVNFIKMYVTKVKSTYNAELYYGVAAKVKYSRLLE